MGRRVALLARPGVACDRLRGALADAGAHVVLEADPMTLDPAALGASEAQVVMVALDAQVEDVLQRFDAALQDPAIEVIFEEAELAAQREGWEAARWVRHISAKLHHHANVLPPGAEAAPAFEWNEAGEGSFGRAEESSMHELAFQSDAAQAYESTSTGPVHAFDPPLADIEFDAGLPAEYEGEPRLGDAQSSEDNQTAVVGSAFDPNQDFSYDGSFGAVTEQVRGEAFPATKHAFSPDGSGDLSLDDLRAEPRAALHDLDQIFDGDFAAAAAQVSDPAVAADPEFEAAAANPAVSSVKPVLGLVSTEDDMAQTARADNTATDKRFKRDLASLESRIAGMELVDDRLSKGPAQANGAVLVMSGIGGPDAVRQLLGALPADFARPVLVQQRLDGGRYDKLVAQMQRATSLPVKLAEPGLPAIAGVIYILPHSIGIKVDDAGIQFTDGGNDVLAELPSADSAVLLLSGSDPALVDAVMNHSWAGALVIGQSPDGCYDATAPSALVARGGGAGQPAELARRLSERWRS